MKKSWIKKTGILLAAGLMAASLAGCSNQINGAETALVVNGEAVPLGEANFLLRYQQAQTYYYMEMMGMTGNAFWSSEMEEGQTYADTFKDSVEHQITELMAVKQKATGEYEIVLTEEEESQIADAAAQFMEANPEAGKNFGVTQDQVAEVLRLYTYNNDIKPYLTEDVDREVSDEEAAQSTVMYVRIRKAAAEDETDETAVTEAEETNAGYYADCETLLAQLQSPENADADEETVNTLADAVNEDFFAMQYSYGADETTLPEAVTTAAAALEDGAWAQEVIDTDDYYYLVKMIAKFDKEATETKKQSIISTREDEAIQETCEEWANAAEVDVKKCWEDLVIRDEDIYTVVDTTAAAE